MSRHPLAQAGVLITLALLAGCGGSSATSTATSAAGAATGGQPGSAAGGGVPDQPCSLVTKAEAEGIMGVSIDDPAFDSVIGTCSYNAVAGMPGQTKVAYNVNGKALYDRVKGTYTAGEATEVSGVGDSAFSVCQPDVGKFDTLVKARDLLIEVVSTDCDKARVFAVKILGRL